MPRKRDLMSDARLSQMSFEASLRVVCQIVADGSRLVLTWSDGTGDFDPYAIDSFDLGLLSQYSFAAHKELCRLVDIYQDPVQSGRNDCLLKLAQWGHKLYKIIFGPLGAHLVQQWFEDASQLNEIASLEIIINAGENRIAIPWNVIYGKVPPDTWAAMNDQFETDGFWGCAYDLACGLRVDPLRRRPWLDNPRLLFVVDPYTESAMAAASAQDGALLTDFMTNKKVTHGLEVAQTVEQLSDHLKQRPSEIIYWFSHANDKALHLSGNPVDAFNLYDLLGAGGAARRGGLVVLNACQTAGSATSGEAFLSAVTKVGMSGIIGSEEETIDLYANRFGLSFLDSFLQGTHDIAAILRNLRRSNPLYLLYTAYCPPNFRVRKGLPATQMPETQGTPLSGSPGRRLSSISSVIAREYPLPTLPYVALGSYGRRQRALFAGRRADCDRFAMLLDEPATRILILQGASGVGKTSFLRAEVIPFLEEECIGFRFVRDVARSPWPSSAQPAKDEQDPDSGVLFVRAGKDLIAELAQAIYDFTLHPYPRISPTGSKVAIDLRAIISQQAVDTGPRE